MIQLLSAGGGEIGTTTNQSEVYLAEAGIR